MKPDNRKFLKQWVHEEAARLGISVRALQARMYRGKHPFPKRIKRGWHTVEVIES